MTATGPVGGHLGYQWQKNGVSLTNVGTLSGVTTSTLSNSAVAATDTGTYTVVVTDTLNATVSTVTSTGAFLTINTAPVISAQPVALTKDAGISASFSVTATGPVGGHLGYQWQKNGVSLTNAGTVSGVTTSSLSNSAVAATDTGTYTVVVTDTLNATVSTVTSTGAFLTINTAPVISAQPVALTKLVGASASFTVTATGPVGGHLGYQWQKNGVSLTNAGTVSGVTTSSLSNSAVAATDTGTYTVVVTDTLNATVSSVTSSGAFLTVNTPAAITSQPVALTKAVGSIASFSVTATGPVGGHLGYQWQKNGVALTNGVSLTGVTTSTLRDSVAAGDTGTYTVIVTDTLNATVSTMTSTGAFLTVNTPAAITSQPVALTKLVGASASFTVTATGPVGGHLGYQWQKNGVALTNAGTVSGVTTSSLSNSAVAAGDTGTYTVVVTDTLNATVSTVTSTGAFLAVNTAPVISAQPVALTKTVGSIASFTVAATGPVGGHLGYQWQKNGVSLSNSASLTGVTTSTLRDSVAVGDTGTYTVIVNDTLNATVSTVTSTGAFLTVNPPATITSQPVALTKVVGASASFTVTATGPVNGHLGYQWQKNGVSLTNAGTVSGVTTSTLSNSAVAAGDTGTYTVVVTDTLNATVSTVTSAGVYLTVGTVPVITSNPLAQSIQATTQVKFGVTVTGTGPFTYKWIDTTTSDTVVHVSSLLTDTLTIASVANTDAGVYKCVVSNALGQATSNTARLTVTAAALLPGQIKAFAIRMVGSSILFRLPPGSESAKISLMDVWGRTVWARSLGHGIDQLTWNGSSSGSRSTSAGLYIVRMILFDAQQHQTGVLERQISYMP